MGGIRKKTSKRGTTFQRSKIVKKAAETRKKNNRDGRKNAQWKSKKTTDPGIPNSFPFKDQILAELAQAKLAAQEEKERRRLAQKAASKELKGLVLAAQGQAGDDDDEEEEDADEDEVEEGEDEEMDEEDKRLRRKIDREVDEDEYQENPGVLPLYGKKPVNPVGSASDKKRGKQAVSDDEDEEVDDDDEEIPELIDTELPTIQAALDKADVVVEVLDARDPIGFRSTFLENLVLATPNTAESTATPTKKGKKNATPAQPRWTKDKLIILLNKIDLVPRETAEAWLKFLRTSFLDHADRVKVVLFKASFVETPIKPGMTVYGLAKGEQAIPRTIPSGVPVGRDQLIQILNAWKGDKAKAKAATNEDEDEFNVVFLGQPNVGKSAVVNTLLGRPKLTTASTIPVSGVTGPTTTVPVEVVAEFEAGGEGQVRLIDTPGWEFNPPDVDDEEDEDEQMDGGEGDEDEDVKWAVLEEMVARDMLTRNIGRIDKVKDALPLVKQIVNRATPQDLMLAYNIPHFAAGDIETFLISVARAQGRIRKRGDADVEAAAKTVLRDWAHNLFPYYTLPTKSEIEKSSVVPDEQDQKILSVLKPRAELKKIGKGLIRMKVPQVDERELILDEEVVMDDDEDDEDEEDFDAEDDLAEDDLAESGEEVEFDEDDVPSESEAEPEIVVSKANDRKRKRKSSLGPAAAPPTISKKVKTVAFAKDGAEAKRAEVKVGASGKLKRKGGDDDDDVSRDGKKARREELERAAAEARVEAVPAGKREIKGALKKSSLKSNGVKEVATVVKPVKTKKAEKAEKPAVVANGKKATAKSTEVDKPFDFNAI